MRPRTLLAALLLLAAAPGRADYAAGVEAYRAGDYATALTEFRRLAERGVVVAYTNLGYMHALGEGVPPDLAAAAGWFRKAAEAGDAAAQLTLGVMYFNGEGVERDYVESYAWLNLAAAAGRDDALDYMTTLTFRLDADALHEAQRRSRELFDRFGDPDTRLRFTDSGGGAGGS